MSKQLKEALANTPFAVIIQRDPDARRTRYRFYKRADWVFTSRSPTPLEVPGVDFWSLGKALAYAEGLSSGFHARYLKTVKAK